MGRGLQSRILTRQRSGRKPGRMQPDGAGESRAVEEEEEEMSQAQLPARPRPGFGGERMCSSEDVSVDAQTESCGS